MRRRLSSALLPLLAMPLLLSGCGGGGNDDNDSNGGGTPTTGTAVRAGVDIAWDGLSRNFNGPGSARSVRITFVGGSATSTDVVSVVDRRDDPAGYIDTYASAAPVQTGIVRIRLEFYAAKSAGGSRVGVAETGALLKADGTLSRANGDFLQFVTTQSDIASVTISAPTTLEVGQSATLGFAALSAQGQVIALDPGSAFFNADNFFFRVEGNTVTALRSGPANVQVTVDNVTARAEITIVDANSDAVVTVAQVANDLAFSSARDRILVTTPGTVANPNRLLELDPVTGAVGNAYQVGSAPGPIALSRDGGIAYVALNGSGTIRRVNLASGAVEPPFALGSDANGTFVATDLVVSPNDFRTIAVTSTNDDFQYRTAIFRNGEMDLSPVTGNYQNNVLAFNANGNVVFGYDTTTSANTLTRNMVGARALTQTDAIQNAIDGRTLLVAGNRLFGQDGRVLFADTLTAAGRFELENGASAFALDPRAGRAYFVVEAADPNNPNNQSVLRLVTFDTESYARLSIATIPNAREREFSRDSRRLVVTGPNRLALATTDGRILLIDTTKL